MTLINEIYDVGSVTKAELKTFITLLNPFAPHVTEEINEAQNFGGMLANGQWPAFDEAKCVDDEIEIAVQVNGKIKARIMVATEISQEDAVAKAKENEDVKAAIDGKTVIKELYVKGRLVNIVVK